MSQQEVVLLLGSNLGDSKKNIDEAINFLEKEIGSILQKSQYLTSKAVEFESCNYFCNIALRIVTDCSPITLLKRIKQYERKAGRSKDSANLNKYTDRIIDIDIVLYGSLIYESKNLIIPHDKNINKRDFSRKLILQIKDI